MGKGEKERRKAVKWSDAEQIYFVTVFTSTPKIFLGRVLAGKMEVNFNGITVCNVWRTLPEYYPNLRLDEFMVMPHFFHGLLWVKRDVVSKRPLLDILEEFKAEVESRVKRDVESADGLWDKEIQVKQIATESELETIREHIRTCPQRFDPDRDPEDPNNDPNQKMFHRIMGI